jgi:chlorophyllide a reductase subunit Z
MASDLAEIRRLVEGIGAEVNMVFPLGSHLADVSRLVEADVNICLYREFGRMLCEALERPYLQAPIGLHSTTRLPARRSARCWASTPSPSSSARSTPPSSRCGTSGVQRDAGLLRHRQLRQSSPTRPTRAACAASSRTSSACRCNFAVARRPGEKTDNAAVRAAGARRRRRWCCSAATTSACTLPSAGGQGAQAYIPASLPGAIVRRHTGTPFMGYAGATYLGAGVLQRPVRRAVPHPAAGHRHGPHRGHDPARAGARPAR